jgi:hypothetical protein
MTFDELMQSLSSAQPPAGASPALRALWLAKKGDWDGAHRLATDVTTEMGSRIHAYLHRVEGDDSNARYWYRQARVSPETGTLDEEWEKLARELTGSSR